MEKPFVGFGFAFENLNNRPYCVLADRREHLPGFVSSLHRHDFFQLWYCYKGSYFHKVEDVVYECKEGSIIILPLGTSHHFWNEENGELMRLDIRTDILDLEHLEQYRQYSLNLFLPDFFEELNLPFSYYRELCPQSRHIWEELFSWFAMLNYAPGGSVPETLIRQKVEQLFSIPEFSLSCKKWDKAARLLQTRVGPILRIVNYLNKHYPEKITDEVLIQEANISRAVMYRYFSRIMKTTYSAFLQTLRGRRAHLYLRETNYSLTDIAELCGFYDIYHMSRVYSKHTGVTLSKQRIRMEICRKEREGIE